MIRLAAVNGENVWELLKLRVAEEQKDFVASNDISLIEAYIALSHGGCAFPFGIYDDDVPVGFLMIGYGADEDWKDAPAVAENNYSLWRLMIDARFQHHGFGKAALAQALAFIRSCPCGPADFCWVSYAPANTAAKKLYASFGFAETEDYDGDEIIAVLPLCSNQINPVQ